jgi:hypothetical protein
VSICSSSPPGSSPTARRTPSSRTGACSWSSDRLVAGVGEADVGVVVELDGDLRLDLGGDLRLADADDEDHRQDVRLGRWRLDGEDLADGGHVQLGVARHTVLGGAAAAGTDRPAQSDHEGEPRDPRSHRRRG